MFLVARGYPQGVGRASIRPASHPVHSTLEDAQKEAERLARTTSGKFYVFMALSVSESQEAPVKTTFL